MDRRSFVVLLAWSVAPLCLSQAKNSEADLQPKMAANPPQSIDCQSYLANPDPGHLAYSLPENKVFFLGRAKGFDLSAKAMSYVLELDLAAKKITKRLSLKVKNRASLVPHSSPTTAISIFDFVKSNRRCGQGSSQGVGLQWGQTKQVTKTFEKGRYKILPTSRGQMVIDLLTAEIKQFDPELKQKRHLASLPKQGLPVYFDNLNKISLHLDPQDFGQLLRFDTVRMKLISQLKLGKGMKLIQRLDKFAVMQPDESQRLINVRLIKGWSGQASKLFKYPINQKHGLGEVRLDVDFSSGLGLIRANSPEAAKEWQKAYLFDGSQGKLVETFKAPPGQYIAIADLHPVRQEAIIVTKSISDESLGGVAIYDLKMNKTQIVRIEN